MGRRVQRACRGIDSQTCDGVAKLAAYLAAAWGAWRRRFMVIPALYASSVLLLCDAWFDITLSWNTHA